MARAEGFDRHSAGPKLHDGKPACLGRFPCEMPQAFLTPNASLRSLILSIKPNKKPIFRWVLSLARWEGANSNTYPQAIEVTEGLILSLTELAHKLRRLGI